MRRRNPTRIRVGKAARSVKKELELIFAEYKQPIFLNKIETEVMNVCKLNYKKIAKDSNIGVIETLRWILSLDAYPIQDHQLITDQQILRCLIGTFLKCRNGTPLSVDEEIEKLTQALYPKTNIVYGDDDHLSHSDRILRRHLVYYIDRLHEMKTKKRLKYTKKSIEVIHYGAPKYTRRFSEFLKQESE